MDKNSFGTQLKNLRKSADITQEQFAETFNVHVQTVSKWERGVSEPDVALLGDIAKALGVTLEKLVGAEELRCREGVFDAQALGKKICELRRALNENQRELAAAVNVSSDTVSKWERGIVCPAIDSLVALSQHFGASFSELYYALATPSVAAKTAESGGREKSFIKFIISAACILLASALALGAYFIFRERGHAHAFGEWQAVVEADCENGGELVRTCSCGEEERKATAALGHSVVTVEGKPATCYEEGRSSGRICERCGEVFLKPDLLPMLAHVVSDWIVIAEPEGDEDGLEIKECLLCGTTLRTRKIPANN